MKVNFKICGFPDKFYEEFHDLHGDYLRLPFQYLFK